MSSLPQAQRQSRREKALASFQFSEEVVSALSIQLERNLPVFFSPGKRNLLGSEPFVLSWLPLLCAAGERGVRKVLEESIFELTFPIAEGASRTPAYQALSLPGWGNEVPPRAENERMGPVWEAPDKWRMFFFDTAGGLLPVIETCSRHDFVAMVQAVIHHNEPVPVPESIGSFMVMGYSNRKVYGEIRNALAHGFLMPEARDPRLWSDKFLLISPGHYSNVAGEDLGFAPNVWPEISRRIRLEHEGCHYLIRRLFPRLQFGIQDELIADFAGLVGAVGEFRASWFLRFMGIDESGIHTVGRSAYYQAPFARNPAAWQAIGKLLSTAAHNLEAMFSQWDLSQWLRQRHIVLSALTWMGLEEIAAPTFADTFKELTSCWSDD